MIVIERESWDNRIVALEFRFLVGPEVVEAEKQIPADQKVAWPMDSIVMYGYEDDKVVGRIGAMSLKIIEGTWCAPEKRGSTLPLRMMQQFEAMYATWLGSTVGAFVADSQPEVAGYLLRVGYEKLPVTFYTKTLTKGDA